MNDRDSKRYLKYEIKSLIHIRYNQNRWKPLDLRKWPFHATEGDWKEKAMSCRFLVEVKRQIQHPCVRVRCKLQFFPSEGSNERKKNLNEVLETRLRNEFYNYKSISFTCSHLLDDLFSVSSIWLFSIVQNSLVN